MKEWEFRSVKTLENLNYGKNDEIVEIAKIELKLKRLEVSNKSTNILKKLIIPKKYLHHVLQAKSITEKLQRV